MGAELEFRTAVGGYKKDDVLEYVENMNDKLDQMTRDHEEETKRYQSRIRELEEQLKQEETNSAVLAEDQDKRLEGLAKENSRLQDALALAEEKQKFAQQEYLKTEQMKNMIKDKLAREILRLREENKELKEKLEEAEGNIGSKADYEGVRSAVSEVQYKIAEYVNVLNKTQQKLAGTYQDMNSIKKRIAAGQEEAQKNNWSVSIAVADDGGHLLALSRMDDCAPIAAYISQEKARTAALGRRETKGYEEMVNNGRTAFVTAPLLTSLEGGVPVVVDGQIIGAVGVSGLTGAQDAQVAKAAAAVLAK